ncbi:MAG: heparinase II/III family protein, partial [Alphaproteobacteria bacterium]|nr:heparinase II/III family protein [Alphaproteobacteria bacterium]
MTGPGPLARVVPNGAMVREMLAAEARLTLAPARAILMRNGLYRRLLLWGAPPARLLYHPVDAVPRRLEDADALLGGRFRFAGETVEAGEGSIFNKPAPSRAWAGSLHGFAWLPPLVMAGGEPARKLAIDLTAQWLKRYPHYSEPAWSAPVMTRRLMMLLAHGETLFVGTPAPFQKALLSSMREQGRLLPRILDDVIPGIPRFEAVIAAALEIHADGGHVSRSPEALFHAYRYLTMLIDALTKTGRVVPQPLRSAHDRMAPMIRFFRHGDGGLALFHGGLESDPRITTAMLARDEVRGQPHAHAPHSGFQRMAAGRSYVVMDCGGAPPPEFSRWAHASALAFEFSAGPQRIVVNCGAALHQSEWSDALRRTAAHSTLVVADTSSAAIMPPGRLRRLFGARLQGGPAKVETNRMQTPYGAKVFASHDGYLTPFGIVHERTLALGPQGAALNGTDRLVPQGKTRRGTLEFAIRFHVHPDVRLSPSQGGGVLLKLPDGEGWRFRAGGGQVGIEESVYLGNGKTRKTEQIVVTAAVKQAPIE